MKDYEKDKQNVSNSKWKCKMFQNILIIISK
jgi:hypothetical protein